MRAAVAALTAATLLVAAPTTAQSPVIATVDGAGEITKGQFNHWVRIAMNSSGPARRRPEPLPKPSTRRWRVLKGVVMELLIQNLWVSGETAERGIVVTDEEVDRAFRRQKRQSFRDEREFRLFLRTSGFTVADIKYRVRLEQLSNKLRREVTRGVAKPTEEELRAYYDEHLPAFVLPERRDVRYAVARTRAAAVAKRKRLRRNASRRAFPSAVFRSRRGVVRWRGRWLAFRVVRVRPRRTQSFEEAWQAIHGILVSERQQEALDAFLEEFKARWRARTECRERYATRDCGRRIA